MNYKKITDDIILRIRTQHNLIHEIPSFFAAYFPFIVPHNLFFSYNAEHQGENQCLTDSSLVISYFCVREKNTLRRGWRRFIENEKEDMRRNISSKLNTAIIPEGMPKKEIEHILTAIELKLKDTITDYVNTDENVKTDLKNENVATSSGELTINFLNETIEVAQTNKIEINADNSFVRRLDVVPSSRKFVSKERTDVVISVVTH
jgi:hypothetical protein